MDRKPAITHWLLAGRFGTYHRVTLSPPGQ